MEIETKIFDVKKVRKVLTKKEIEPYRVADIIDILFDISGFSAQKWGYDLPNDGTSGKLILGSVLVEIPDVMLLGQISDFFIKDKNISGGKIRLRTIDGVPFITIKGPKKNRSGVKSREELEVKIGSLSDMTMILLQSGAKLKKSVSRIREIYEIPEYPHSELIIDTLYSAHETLEYAEIESPNLSELREIIEDVFGLDTANISAEGINRLHTKTLEKSVSRKLKTLEKSSKTK